MLIKSLPTSHCHSFMIDISCYFVNDVRPLRYELHISATYVANSVWFYRCILWKFRRVTAPLRFASPCGRRVLKKNKSTFAQTLSRRFNVHFCENLSVEGKVQRNFSANGLVRRMLWLSGQTPNKLQFVCHVHEVWSERGQQLQTGLYLSV